MDAHKKARNNSVCSEPPEIIQKNLISQYSSDRQTESKKNAVVNDSQDNKQQLRKFAKMKRYWDQFVEIMDILKIPKEAYGIEVNAGNMVNDPIFYYSFNWPFMMDRSIDKLCAWLQKHPDVNKQAMYGGLIKYKEKLIHIIEKMEANWRVLYGELQRAEKIRRVDQDNRYRIERKLFDDLIKHPGSDIHKRLDELVVLRDRLYCLPGKNNKNDVVFFKLINGVKEEIETLRIRAGLQGEPGAGGRLRGELLANTVPTKHELMKQVDDRGKLRNWKFTTSKDVYKAWENVYFKRNNPSSSTIKREVDNHIKANPESMCRFRKNAKSKKPGKGIAISIDAVELKQIREDIQELETTQRRLM